MQTYANDKQLLCHFKIVILQNRLNILSLQELG